MLREVTTHFIVDMRALSKTGGGCGRIKVRVVNPSGGSTDTFVTDKGDGTYRVEYTAFEDGEGDAGADGVAPWRRDESRASRDLTVFK